MSGTREPSSNVTFSVDTDFDGRVHLVAYVPTEDGERDRQEFILEPSTYTNLLRDLTSHALYGLSRVSQQQIMGDCVTCKNVRLIEVTRSEGRRTEQVHCPDCFSAEKINSFARPRIGGGIR